MLERHGYSVTCVYEGQEGLEVAARGNHDLCLLNVLLPGMNGYSIAERLQEGGVDIPLIFYTDKPEHEVKTQIRSMGIRAAHIQKPPSIRGLVEKIEEVLGGRGLI
jgi:DNA-binding response OmpR family regulator